MWQYLQSWARLSPLQKAVIANDEKLVFDTTCPSSLDERNAWGLSAKDLALFLGRRSLMQRWGLFPSFTFLFQGPNDAQPREVTVQDLEAKTHFRYFPTLCFPNIRSLWRARAQTDLAKPYVESEMLWLGAYFQTQIESGAPPHISIRWIDREVGYGVFAEQDFAKGAFVGEYTGLVRLRPCFGFQASDYCFRYPTYRFHWVHLSIDGEPGGNFTRFINHSADPNLESLAVLCRRFMHITFRSIAPVKKGEQLLYDYGPEYWRKRDKPTLFA